MSSNALEGLAMLVPLVAPIVLPMLKVWRTHHDITEKLLTRR
jgi:hypothetical protein